MELLLTAELVPSTSWYNNLRKAMTATNWTRVRKKVYEEYEFRCGICGVEGELHCHECWLYDDENHVQTLDGFIALCPWCHHIKHLGLAGIMASEGRLDYERLIRHFMQVNGCDRATFLRHRDAAFDQWERRSRFPWTVTFGRFAGLIQQNAPGSR